MNLISNNKPPRQPLKILRAHASTNKNLSSAFPSGFKVKDGIKTTTWPEAMNREDCSGSKSTLSFSCEALVLSWHLFEVSQPFVKIHDEVRVSYAQKIKIKTNLCRFLYDLICFFNN